jgi:large subunit ribosomal protein L6
MSRIGKLPITLPDVVSVTINKNVVTIKGPKGELQQTIDPDITVKVEGSVITVERPTEQKRHKALHGLYRALINNMVVGVSQGYKVQLEIAGVGYKAAINGAVLELSLGYSHGIFMGLPPEIKANAIMEKGKSPIITIEGIDKQLVGQVAAKIKSLRPVSPYKAKGTNLKGIFKTGEHIRTKAGKAAAKK